MQSLQRLDENNFLPLSYNISNLYLPEANLSGDSYDPMTDTSERDQKSFNSSVLHLLISVSYYEHLQLLSFEESLYEIYQGALAQVSIFAPSPSTPKSPRIIPGMIGQKPRVKKSLLRKLRKTKDIKALD